MSASPTVRVERDGPITTVILSRPEVRNAVDGPTARALADAFLAFERDDSAQVGVFFGDHGAFCAGADLKALSRGSGNPVVPPRTGAAFDPLAADGPMGCSRMLLSKPVIAAVAGHAVAGGLELALWCDLRVVEEDAVFGVFCRRWGVPLIDGGTIRLPRIVGHGRALDLILTARRFAQLRCYGLATACAHGRARTEAEALAREIARSRRSACARPPIGLSSGICRTRGARQSIARMHAMRRGDRTVATRFAQGHGAVQLKISMSCTEHALQDPDAHHPTPRARRAVRCEAQRQLWRPVGIGTHALPPLVLAWMSARLEMSPPRG